MNRSILKALYLDAFYQVLDNKVFRLLAILAALFVLPTFVIGAREQGLVFLYGVKTIPWKEIGWLTGGLTNPELIVQRFQQIVVGSLAGTVGILFSIAATAFFVPRMLEKGAADVVFSKPISRVTLLVARYLAGVLFVALLATVLVVGMHVGLLLVSGTSDAAFLWSIPTIVYVFALVHSVSLVVGVFTRSSVAAILSTVLFFSFNGCVHQGWIIAEFVREHQRAEREESVRELASEKPGSDKVEAAKAEHGESGLSSILLQCLDAVHFVLPKTTDADLIVNKLRKAIVDRAPLLREKPIGLSVLEGPEGFELGTPHGDVDLAQTPARWTKSAGTGPLQADISLRREPRVLEGKHRTARTAAKNLKTALEKSGVKSAAPKNDKDDPFADAHPDERVSWTEDAPDGSWHHTTGFLVAGEWLYVVEARERADDSTPAQTEQHVRDLLKSMRVDEDDPRNPDPGKWYQRHLDWTAPWRHNIFFSIGSSLLFAAVLFWLAAWRLKRIDF